MKCLVHNDIYVKLRTKYRNFLFFREASENCIQFSLRLSGFQLTMVQYNTSIDIPCCIYNNKIIGFYSRHTEDLLSCSKRILCNSAVDRFLAIKVMKFQPKANPQIPSSARGFSEPVLENLLDQPFCTRGASDNQVKTAFCFFFFSFFPFQNLFLADMVSFITYDVAPNS